MIHLYYKVLIDCVEVAIFDSDNEIYLANFIRSTIKSCAKRVDIIAGYYDGNNKWHDYKNIDTIKILRLRWDNIEEEDC